MRFFWLDESVEGRPAVASNVFNEPSAGDEPDALVEVLLRERPLVLAHVWMRARASSKLLMYEE